MSSSLIVVEQGSLSFGGQKILHDLSLRIGTGEKIGLIGPNGSGKSTLLRVMIAEQGLDSGRVVRARDCQIGYLPQDILQLPRAGLLASVLATVPGRADLEQRMVSCESALARADSPDDQMELAQRIAELHDSLDHFETYYGEQHAIRILKGLGFAESELDRDTSELSGGWKMRAALAGLLFQQPDILLLDEPTNHLDVPSVLWLEEFLTQYKHAIVLICHDRAFLNRHIERVISFEPEGVRFYRGDYDNYLQQRASEEEILGAQARNREKQVKELERFVERFKAKASKARQAQSKAKQIERMQREIERPLPRARRLRFTFGEVERSGRDVVRIDGLCKAYGERRLYDGLDKQVFAGDRVAIIGANGVGKTTLLKLIAKEIDPDAGTVSYGANVRLGYYAQHHTDLLDPRQTVLEQVWRVRPDASESLIRGVCGAFLFSGDDVEKSVGVLSGGERARVLLARLLTNPGNLLLMDEPTNHLDIAAAEALADALAGFGGTLVFVSHNTSFIDRLATKIWDIGPRGLEEYPGNLREYLEHRARRDAPPSAPPKKREGASTRPLEAGQTARRPVERATAVTNSPAPVATRQQKQEKKDRRRKEAERRNELSRRTRRARDEIQQIEQRIAVIEDDQKLVEPLLASPEVYEQKDRFRETLERYNQNREKLEQLYARWEHRQSELERISAEEAQGDACEA